VIGLVTFSGWTSLKKASGWGSGWLRSAATLRDRWDSLGCAPQITVPWLIIHGTADGTIPYRCGQELLEAAPKGILASVIGGDHNDESVRRSGCAALQDFGAAICGTNLTQWQIREATQAASTNPPILYVHGFNNTDQEIDNRGKALQEVVGDRALVLAVKWPSAAGRLQEWLQLRFHSAQAVAGSVAVPSYASDNAETENGQGQADIASQIPEGQFYLLAHSRGCHVTLEWIHRNAHRWKDILRVVLLHPDTPRSEFGNRCSEASVKSDATDPFSEQLKDIINEKVNARFQDFAREKIGCFDVQMDYATLVSAGLGHGARTALSQDPTQGSRSIGDLCCHHKQVKSISHSFWLDEDCREPLEWLLSTE